VGQGILVSGKMLGDHHLDRVSEALSSSQETNARQQHSRQQCQHDFARLEGQQDYNNFMTGGSAPQQKGRC
jgi:hypothetical protein